MKLAANGYCSRYKKHTLESIVCLYLGKNGMGSSMMINGSVWHGANEFAGELYYIPIEENSLKKSENDFTKINLIEYYAKIIQSYTAIINPNRIILYENNYIINKIDEIRKLCVKSLPPISIPEIEISQEFILDYEYGLYDIAFNTYKEFKD
jgi:galactitol-specific phosphotransferase system IIB component